MNDTIWEDKSHCSALSSHSSRSSVNAEIFNMESWTLTTSMLLVLGMLSPNITLKEPTPGSYGGTTEPGGDAVQPKVMGGLRCRCWSSWSPYCEWSWQDWKYHLSCSRRVIMWVVDCWHTDFKNAEPYDFFVSIETFCVTGSHNRYLGCRSCVIPRYTFYEANLQSIAEQEIEYQSHLLCFH